MQNQKTNQSNQPIPDRLVQGEMSQSSLRSGIYRVSGEPEVQPSNQLILDRLVQGEIIAQSSLRSVYTGFGNGEPEVQPEKPTYTEPIGTAGDTAPVEPALPSLMGGVNGESTVQAELPVWYTEVKLETMNQRLFTN